MNKLSTELENIVSKVKDDIEQYNQFINEWFSQACFPYASFDIRCAGFKISHVDANLYSAGFNLLSEEAKIKAQEAFDTFFGDARKILIYPENFSRNERYRDNINTLKDIIEKTGRDVKLGHIEPHDNEYSKISLQDRKLKIGDWVPDAIVLNNDFSDGKPEFMEEIDIPIYPSYKMGWYRRLKSEHFKAYDTVLSRFAKLYDIDSWLLSAFFDSTSEVDFSDNSTLISLMSKIENLRSRIQGKYKEYNINAEPHIFLKSDFGTFGMGMMVVKSAQDIENINKKIRNKMSTVKGGQLNSKILLQEAVPTIESIRGHTAETMAYTVNNKLVDLILRANQEKNNISNLNSKGMYFERHTCKPGIIYKMAIDLALCAIVEEMKLI